MQSDLPVANAGTASVQNHHEQQLTHVPKTVKRLILHAPMTNNQPQRMNKAQRIKLARQRSQF